MPVRTNASISGHHASTVVARVSSSGIWESTHQVSNRCSRCRVRCASPPTRTVDSRVRSSSFAIQADRICALGSSSLIRFHILAKLFARQPFPGGEQPASVGPLRVDLAATPIAQVPGDAAAHPAERVVGQLHQVDVVDHDRRVRQQPLGAQRRRVHRGRVDRHVLDSLPELRCSCLQPFDHRGSGAAGVLSSSPCSPSRSTNPVSHGSTRTHRCVSMQYVHLGLPRRVSSIPNTRTGSGSTSRASACSMKARCAVGHDTRCAAATSRSDRAASPIADPIWVRKRRVVRARGGTSGIDSVERPDLAGRLLASPSRLAPAHQDSIVAVECPSARWPCTPPPTSTPRHATGTSPRASAVTTCTIRGHRPSARTLNTDTANPDRFVVASDTPSRPLPRLNRFATFRLRKNRGPRRTGTPTVGYVAHLPARSREPPSTARDSWARGCSATGVEFAHALGEKSRHLAQRRIEPAGGLELARVAAISA